MAKCRSLPDGVVAVCGISVDGRAGLPHEGSFGVHWQKGVSMRCSQRGGVDSAE